VSRAVLDVFDGEHRARQAAAVRAGSGQRSAGLRGARWRAGRAPRSPAVFLEGAVAAQWELGLLLEGSEGLDERR
jgi:hypothetical protein